MRLAPGSRCLVFGLGARHFKLPLSAGALRGLSREQRGEILALGDPFWAPYVLPARYCGGFLKFAARGADTVTDAAMSRIQSDLRQRTSALALAKGSWAHLFSRVLSLVATKDGWEARLDQVFAGEARASMHGDFCRTNCLDLDNRLFLIDWGNFRPEFWAPYDLLHCDVIEQVEQSGDSWVDCLRGLIADGRINRPRAARYLVCRCELEGDQDFALGRLTDRRRRKYADSLSWARDELIE